MASLVRLRRFQPENMAAAPIALVFGGPGSGKSALLRDLCESKRDAVNFVSCAQLPSPEALDAYLVALRREGAGGRQQHCVVADGVCSDDRDLLACKGVRRVVANGRALHTGLLASFDDASVALDDPALCAVADYVFLLAGGPAPARVYDAFLARGACARWLDRGAFGRVAARATETPYACLVLDLARRVPRAAEDVLHWYEAVDRAERVVAAD